MQSIEKRDWASFANFFMQEFLYMFPAHADEVLLQELRSRDEAAREAKWYARVLSWDADELALWAAREGDPEDKCAIMDVFLWRQRHGLIDKNRRIHSSLGAGARPLTYLIHRYMVANDYDGILAGDDPYTQVGIKYIQEIDALLEQWKKPDFGPGDAGFWDIVLLLNVVGPTFATFDRRPNARELAEYILENHSVDPRLQGFRGDRELSALALLLSDLKIEPDRTWPVFQSLLLSTRQRSVLAYPALIVGAKMYGKKLDGILGEVDLQGGTSLFISLIES
jgi:hypothetical protein